MMMLKKFLLVKIKFYYFCFLERFAVYRFTNLRFCASCAFPHINLVYLHLFRTSWSSLTRRAKPYAS